MTLPTSFAAGALYDDLLHAALRRFFPRAELSQEVVPSMSSFGRMAVESTDDPHRLSLRWFGTRHTLAVPNGQPFTAHEVRLAKVIGAVLGARYRAIFEPKLMVERGDLFQGAIDDRYVGAFVDTSDYGVAKAQRADLVAAAIEIARVAAVSSYENSAISSGVLLLSRVPQAPVVPPAARVRYSSALAEIKSFYKLCDGVRTVFLLSDGGEVLDVVDIARFATESVAADGLDVPCPQLYRPHARATQGTGHVCVVLSPSHEIKVFAEGLPVFTFRHGNWHLLDLRAKYQKWVAAVQAPAVAERLFQTALDLSEARQGALFVVLRDPTAALPHLLAPVDRLSLAWEAPSDGRTTRHDLLSMMSGRSIGGVDPSVLSALASMDGATVTDRHGRLLGVGAILLHPPDSHAGHAWVSEGARSTAASAASRFGPVLKVSQDGVITFYDGERIWDL
jgi:hypothetical protein